MLKDPYFVDRKLYPNVDFYSGLIYRALGFPTTMFTVMFALRVVRVGPGDRDDQRESGAALPPGRFSSSLNVQPGL